MTFSDYALADHYVHRVFLPVVSTTQTGEDEPLTSPWAPLAADAGVELDASVSCADVVGWG